MLRKQTIATTTAEEETRAVRPANESQYHTHLVTLLDPLDPTGVLTLLLLESDETDVEAPAEADEKLNDSESHSDVDVPALPVPAPRENGSDSEGDSDNDGRLVTTDALGLPVLVIAPTLDAWDVDDCCWDSEDGPEVCRG